MSVVFAIIPVFNRLQITLDCIRKLKDQTYSPIQIIISDGGSTDGSQEKIRQMFSDVTVLTTTEPLWWGGAMAAGIQWTLQASKDTNDFVLMMNNDTDFPPDYVRTLVSVSERTKGAVGALTVDSRDHSIILDAGEFIDWVNYRFPVKTQIVDNETECTEVDFLPGRGSLIPIQAIRNFGNINATQLPHYISDYEFFHRMKLNGVPLTVTYKTWVAAFTEMTGLFDDSERLLSTKELWNLYFSRKSMSNFVDHWIFIRLCAPANLKNRLLYRHTVSYLINTFKRHFVLKPILNFVRFFKRIILYPFRWVWGVAVRVGIKVGAYGACKDFFDWVFSNHPIKSSELDAFGLSPEKLKKDGVIFCLREAGTVLFSRKYLLSSKIFGFSDEKLRSLHAKIAGRNESV